MVPAERPALRDAFDHVRVGDTLVVWRLDRLGRSPKDLMPCCFGVQPRIPPTLAGDACTLTG